MGATSRHQTPSKAAIRVAAQLPSSGEAETRAAVDRDWSMLMARAQSGDRAAYRRLLVGITPYLRVLARRRHNNPADVEDAVQDVLLTVHAVRNTYDPSRPFGPWLVAIANRRLVDRLRRQERVRSREAPLTEMPETFAVDETNYGEEMLRRVELHAAVAKLPRGQRHAVAMLKLQEMSLKEASEARGMSVASLKIAVHRALKNLRKLLADRGPQP